jgi:Transposase DDE domain
VALPQELSPLWPGCGGSGAKATIKLSVSLDLTWGVLAGPLLTGGRCHDQQAATQQAQLPQGALRLVDLGYFNLDAFAQMSAQGVYYLSRFKVGTKLFGEDGAELELPRALHQLAPSFDIKVELGQRHRLSARLMGLRVPQEVAAQRRRRLKDRARKKSQQPSKAQLNLCEWTLLVTNAPVELIRLQEALVLAQARWQIELLFKLWKQYGQIDAWASQKPVRILCELSAKLLAMIIQHWVLLVSCWSYPDRSLMKAAQTVQSYATMMASALTGLIELDLLLSQVARCISLGCRLNRRRKRPSTCQLLLNLTQEPLN